LTVACSAPQQSEPVRLGPIAIVNGQPVDAADYHVRLALLVRDAGKDLSTAGKRRLGEGLIEQLIDEQLLADAIDDAGISVTGAELEAATEEYAGIMRTRALLVGKPDAPNPRSGRLLAGWLTRRLALLKLFKVTVTDAEIEAFYAKNEAGYAAEGRKLSLREAAPSIREIFTNLRVQKHRRSLLKQRRESAEIRRISPIPPPP